MWRKTCRTPARQWVRCVVEVPDEFKVGMGLHQGLTLSPFLFLMVMDSLTGEVRQGSTLTNDAY